MVAGLAIPRTWAAFFGTLWFCLLFGELVVVGVVVVVEVFVVVLLLLLWTRGAGDGQKSVFVAERGLETREGLAEKVAGPQNRTM